MEEICSSRLSALCEHRHGVCEIVREETCKHMEEMVSVEVVICTHYKDVVGMVTEVVETCRHTKVVVTCRYVKGEEIREDEACVAISNH